MKGQPYHIIRGIPEWRDSERDGAPLYHRQDTGPAMPSSSTAVVPAHDGDPPVRCPVLYGIIPLAKVRIKTLKSLF